MNGWLQSKRPFLVDRFQPFQGVNFFLVDAISVPMVSWRMRMASGSPATNKYSRIKVYCETLQVMKISSLWNAKIVDLLNLLKFSGLQYIERKFKTKA